MKRSPRSAFSRTFTRSEIVHWIFWNIRLALMTSHFTAKVGGDEEGKL